MLMVNGRQNGELYAENEYAASYREENLTHDDVPNISARLTEMNHQPQPKDIERHAHPQYPFESTRDADEPSGKEEKDKRDHAKGITDIPSCSHIRLVHHLQERSEITCIAVVGDLIGHVEETCAHDRAVDEEFVIQKWRRGEVDFIEAEDDEHDKADDDHGDDVACLPAVGGCTGESEGEKEDDEAAGEKYDSDDYHRSVSLCLDWEVSNVLRSNSVTTHQSDCRSNLHFFPSLTITPCFSALRKLSANIK